MEFFNLNFDEQPLTREDLLRIKGGVNPAYTVSGCTGCSDTASGHLSDDGDSLTADCTDGCTKD
ncbi:hypothetical protein [Mucilaginibacter sp. CSA2-8R]|uniref:hypothetical protein n=1 Tax=Mucilaginibacter sp. CSA2-8R TaxID=3141542 RepID=UPI00315D8255